MNDPDWNPLADEVLRDPRAAYDAMRERCPVASSEGGRWSLFRHEDVVRVLGDHATFSNAVSRHLSVPNGMDPPEHTAYRRIIEPYFAPERVAAFEPICRGIAVALLQKMLESDETELVAGFALPFAVQVQCAFLNWPPALHERLRCWTARSREATLAGDRQTLAEIAAEFERLVDEMLETRRQSHAAPQTDLTASLMHEKVEGRPLSHQEIASILRNWTVGEIGTIAASLGILAEHLAQHPDLQNRLRGQPSLQPAAIDEILRLHGPLVANRRVTTCPVEMGGRKIAQGAQVTINWIAANRDGRVFEDPETFRLDRDPGKNLLYGAGIHVCPGAPLARMEMRVCMEELLQRTSGIAPVPGKAPTRALHPASGYSALPLKLRKV